MMTKKEIMEAAREIQKEIEILRQCERNINMRTLQVLRDSDCVCGIALTECDSTWMEFEVSLIDGSSMEVTLAVADWRRER